MRIPLLCIVLAHFLFSNSIFAQNWQWAKTTSKSVGCVSSMPTQAVASTTDSHGNIYVVGLNDSCAVFDFASINKSSYIAKYNPSGNLVWLRGAGRNVNTKINAITIDESDNIYIAGVIYGDTTITFGSITLTTRSQSNFEIFLVKYDTLGNAIWGRITSRTPNRNGNNTVGGITTDKAGNVYITGTNEYYFGGSVSSDTVSYGGAVFVVHPNLPGSTFTFDYSYLVKYDGSGNPLWIKECSYPLIGYPGLLPVGWFGSTAITHDNSGGIYITGFFENFYSLPISFDAFTLSDAGDVDLFVVKYDQQGNVKWAKSLGGSAMDAGYAICADVSGHIYVTGMFMSAGFPFGSHNLTNLSVGANVPDAFLVKYDTAGNELWGASAGHEKWDEGKFVATNATDDVFWGGFFGSNDVWFDNDTLTNSSSTSGAYDGFLVKYNSTGNVEWVNNLRGADSEVPTNCILPFNGTVNYGYVSGYFSSPYCYLDTIKLNKASSGGNMFLTRFSDGTVGVPSFSNFEVIEIFPNPSKNDLTIRSSDEINTIDVYNILGQNVIHRDCNMKSMTLDISGLLMGNYVVRVNSVKNIRFLKV